MTISKVARMPSYEMDNPPAGIRLSLGAIAAQLQITISDMAEATGISRTAIANVLMNVWPIKTDKTEIQAALHKLFEARGASDEHLRTMWWAHGHRSLRALPSHVSGKPNTDRYGRDLDAEGKPVPGVISQKKPAQPRIAEDTDMLLAKQTLSRAALKAFAIFTNPFDGEVVSDEQMFTSPEIAYIRESCLQAAISQRFVAIVAESGGGKSTIMLDLEHRLKRDSRQVIVIKPWVLGMVVKDNRGSTLKASDILASIIITLDPLATVPQTMRALAEKASRLLTRSAEAGFMHLLLIEEAHSMPDATLAHLKRLHEMRHGRRPMMGILLLAQPELMTKLSPTRPSLREVTQRCEIVQLMPLDADLQPYLAHRAKLSGKPLEHYITDDGIEALRRRLTVLKEGGNGKQIAVSLLYPLAVNNMMTAALNRAAELGAPVIDRDVVHNV